MQRFRIMALYLFFVVLLLAMSIAGSVVLRTRGG